MVGRRSVMVLMLGALWAPGGLAQTGGEEIGVRAELDADGALRGADGAPPGRVHILNFHRDSCPFCRKADRAVARRYARHPEYRAVRMLKVHRDTPAWAALAPVHGVDYTPVYVLVVDGHGVKRMNGYQGERTVGRMLYRALRAMAP